MNIIMDYFANYFEWIKSFHIIFVITWMSGMFYLPRLFVYHADIVVGSSEYKRFCIMEKKLLKIIMNPSMILTFIFGFLLSIIYGISSLGEWFHIKLTLVIIMSGIHGLFAKSVKDFANNNNNKSSKFYRIINEIPVILMILIVFLVVIKPLE